MYGEIFLLLHGNNGNIRFGRARRVHDTATYLVARCDRLDDHQALIVSSCKRCRNRVALRECDSLKLGCCPVSGAISRRLWAETSEGQRHLWAKAFEGRSI